MALMEKLFLITFLRVSISQAQQPSPRLTVRALRGSCVVIPCTFSNPEQRAAPGELRIIWVLQKTHKVIYNSKSPDLVTPQYRGRTDFVGDLKSGDCSLRINDVRGEDAADYYPWIKPLTERIESYRVTVSDHPEEVYLGEPGEMIEGIAVKFTCSVVHTCPSSPPTLTWDWKDSNVSNYHEDLSNGRWKVISEMYYQPMAQDHGKSLQCTATYTETITSKKNITMAIKYPPKKTEVVIHGNATLREGDTVTLSCSAVSNPDVFNYSWYVGQEEKPSLGHGQNFTAKSISWNSGPYSCIATNAVGSGNSSALKLSIERMPPAAEVPCTYWWVTLTVALGMFLCAVLGVVLFYERCAKKANGVTPGGSSRVISDMENGTQALTVVQSPEADYTYMALKHGDRTTYGHLKRAQN